MAHKRRREFSSDNPKKIFLAAESFYFSAGLIGGCVIDRMPNSDILCPMNADDINLNLTAASITNEALALELFLKCLSVIERNVYSEGHLLIDLFNDLSKFYRDKINKYYAFLCKIEPGRTNKVIDTGRLPIPDIYLLLEEAGEPFRDYRYFYENKTRPYFIHEVVSATRGLLIELNPDWQILAGGFGGFKRI